MIDKITFLNDHLQGLILFGALILFVLFIWKEWAQAGKKRLILKIFLSLLAISSLALIALKPAFPSSETTGNYILITENYRKDQVDSLQKKYRHIKLKTYNPAQPLPDFTAAEKIFVLGNGVKNYDLWQLEQIPVVYLGGRAPEGIIRLNFPKHKKVGDSLVLKGVYRNSSKGTNLVLQGPGGVGLDSLVFDSEADSEFQLVAELKAPGNFVYALTEKDSLGALLKTNPVPVRIAEKEKLKILILNSFPTFDTKYLKNYLAEAGHELVVRSQLTRGRYKYEYFNTPRTSVGNLTQPALELYDLLIMDAALLRAFSRNQLSAVENAVIEDGLGVLIQPDEAFFRSSGNWFDSGFVRSTNTEIGFTKWPGVSLNSFAFRIKYPQEMQRILIEDQAIAAWKRKGKGRIGTSTLSSTWQLVLEGHETVYKHLWTQILERLSKPEALPAAWEQEKFIVHMNEPFNFRLQTAIDLPIVRNKEGSLLPLKQDVNVQTLWEGTSWPKKAGWHSVQIDTISNFDFYVFQEDAWTSLSQVETGQANLRYFDREVQTRQGDKPLQPVNLLWFYGVFLIAMGGLWLEPKL